MLRRLIRACCSVSVLALSSELVNKDAVKILGSSGIDLYRKLVGSTYVWESTEKCVTISVYIYIYIYGVYIYIYIYICAISGFSVYIYIYIYIYTFHKIQAECFV